VEAAATNWLAAAVTRQCRSGSTVGLFAWWCPQFGEADSSDNKTRQEANVMREHPTFSIGQSQERSQKLPGGKNKHFLLSSNLKQPRKAIQDTYKLPPPIPARTCVKKWSKQVHFENQPSKAIQDTYKLPPPIPAGTCKKWSKQVPFETQTYLGFVCGGEGAKTLCHHAQKCSACKQ
jgi:hypothetical protein